MRLNCDFDQIDLGFNQSLTDFCDYLDLDDIRTDCHARNYTHKVSNSLGILQLNTRGLLHKQDQLKCIIKQMRQDGPIHVILLVETWLKKNQGKRINIPGYKFYGAYRNGKRGGGTGILVSHNMLSRERKDLSMHIPEFENVTVELKTNSDSLYLSSLYRPPNCNEKSFMKNYRKLLSKFSSSQQDRLILGLDHNLDLLKYEKHAITKEFLEYNIDQNLLPTITKPTRVTRTSATLIDNVIIGKTLQDEYDSKIIISDISDHFPSLVRLYKPSLFTKKPTRIETRAIDENKIEMMKTKLDEIDWEHLLLHKGTDVAYSLFHDKFHSIMNDVAPLKTVHIKPSKILQQPWMTPGLQKCQQKQYLLYKQSLGHNSTEGLIIKYKGYRNKLKEIIRKTKEKYYKDKCYEYKQNTAKLWKMINRITHKVMDKTSTIEYLKIDNIDFYDSKAISEEFAKHFSAVGKTYAQKIPKSNKDIKLYLKLIQENPKTMYMTPTTKYEIEKLINGLENKTSSGYDHISNILLKKLKESLLTPLEIIFNASISESVFPHLMKNADVIPLYKSKARYDVNNYRPISLLSTLSKILEKIIHTRTYTFLNSTGQFYQSQYGFRKGHSCEAAIAELVGTIVKNQEEKKYTLGVFIDLSKAFDTLNHNLLFSKLSKYGIRGHCLKWFQSYLSNRCMRMKCSTGNGTTEYSSYYHLDYGTPQGSCLGPLLFLIFINDLHLTITFCQTILFADDTTIFHSHSNLDTLKQEMQYDLTCIMDWFKANQLTLNLDKTISILFGLNNTKIEMDLEIGGYILKTSELVKFLGVWLDQALNWKKHVSTLLIKLKQNTNLLKLGNKFLDKSSKKQVYYAHIYSHLKYGILLWGNMIDQASKDKLQKQVNTCFNLITHLPPNPQNFQKEKMLRVTDLIKIENQRLGYRLHKGLLPSKLECLMWTDSKEKTLEKTHTYNTRQCKLSRLPKAQSKKFHSSFQFNSILAFNSVPLEIRNSNTLDSFTKKLKKIVFA